jgi:tRNA modification GTPase
MADSGDILASLSSPPGEGAIGIVQVCGAGAIELVDGVFCSPRGRRLTDASAGDIVYGKILAGGSAVDEVLVRVASREPQRLEINCHGGAVPHAAIMDLLTGLGARECSWREPALAEDIDAVRREALVRIPAALTKKAALMLVSQYNGALSSLVESGHLMDARDGLLQLAPYGLALCDPPAVVIAGKPNVGKSTLANALLRRERVLAAPAPGTTRDAVTAYMDIDGVTPRASVTRRASWSGSQPTRRSTCSGKPTSSSACWTEARRPPRRTRECSRNAPPERR